MSENQTLSESQRKEVSAIVRKQVLAGVLVLLALLGGIMGISLVGVYKRIENAAAMKIEEQFQEPHISSLMKEVAQGRASALLEEQVTPEVERFKDEVSAQVDEFGRYLGELETEYEKDYASLSAELAILKKRNELRRLGDLGVAEGERSALEELEAIRREAQDDSIRLAAISEIARIKSMWATMTTLTGGKLSIAGPDGKQMKMSDLSTAKVIDEMRSNDQWQVRGLAAQALRERKEKGVPEALMMCAKTESRLQVIRQAVTSFERVTGYDNPDVFSVDNMEEWWAENAEEVNKKLKDPEPKNAGQDSDVE